MGAPVEGGGTIHILNNGDEFVPALLESINQAQRTINFTVYIWSEGTFSDQLLRALEKKQREGVEVRVLLDGLGSLKVPDEDFEPLIAAGGKVQKFRTPEVRQAHPVSPPEPSPVDRHRRRRRVSPVAWRCRTSGLAMRRTTSTGAT